MKNGKVKQLTDKDDIKKYQTLIKSLRTKDSCSDLFSNLPVVLGLVEGEDVDFARQSQYKLLKNEYLLTWRIVHSITKFRCIHGIPLIKSILKRI